MQNKIQCFFRSSTWQRMRKSIPIKLISFIYWKYIHLYNNIHTYLICKQKEHIAQKKQTKNSPYNFGEIYFSLTSFPARLNATYFAICSLFAQDYPVNKILLTLSKEEFPNGEKDVPSKILNFKDKGLEILWADTNLKPHNKYFFAMKKFPNAIIITVDDDILYPKDTVSKLVDCYQKHPKAICALGIRQILVTNGKPLSFSKWNTNLCYEPYRISKEILGQERMDLLAEGGSAVLYPPSILPLETFNITKIKQLAPYADDIWLKCMELVANIPVVCNNDNQKVHIISFSQNVGLYQINMENNQNDAQLLAILESYKEYNLIKRLQQ